MYVVDCFHCRCHYPDWIMLHASYIVVEMQACVSFASYWKPFQSVKHTNAVVDFVFSLFMEKKTSKTACFVVTAQKVIDSLTH